MDYFSAFEISSNGLAVEKLRADLVALNIANANTTVGSKDQAYKALKLVTLPGVTSRESIDFNNIYNMNLGVDVLEIKQDHNDPKAVFDPANPVSDESGYVYKSNVNTASEMIEMMSALRAYQANIKAISAAKVMAEEAIKIGSGR